MRPEALLHFVELDGFRDDWEEFGLDLENDLWDLQIEIMQDPEASPVVQGTNGLRKLRFAPRNWKVGKRGAIRVCYVYFRVHWTVMLVMAYGKNQKEGLTAAERRDIARYIEVVQRWYDAREDGET